MISFVVSVGSVIRKRLSNRASSLWSQYRSYGPNTDTQMMSHKSISELYVHTNSLVKVCKSTHNNKFISALSPYKLESVKEFEEDSDPYDALDTITNSPLSESDKNI